MAEPADVEGDSDGEDESDGDEEADDDGDDEPDGEDESDGDEDSDGSGLDLQPESRATANSAIKRKTKNLFIILNPY